MAESIAVAATQAPPESAFVPMVDEVCYRAQLVARNQKLSSAVGATKVLGFVIGALFALGMVLIPLALLGGL
jgi:tetrahydromethanopterin S-methyltransferase F subunit